MPVRRTSALHRFRSSEPGRTYFVTCCTQQRQPGLTTSVPASAINAAILASDRESDTATQAFTLMPDHCHWLFTLGARLSLGRVVARIKAITNEVLLPSQTRWQRDFFEHGLKPEESAEAYALYIFLNPYRASLIKPDEAWPHWLCPRPEMFSFSGLLNSNGSPPFEWIGQPIPSDLRVGE